MSMRAVDAWPLLSAKEELRKTLAETDCDAVFQSGAVLPVVIKQGGSQLYIELEYQFADPKTVQGFVQFVKKPIPVAPAPVHTQTRQLKGSTTQEIVADAANREAVARGERERGRLAAQGVTSQDVAAGNAEYERRAQEIAWARNPENRKKK